MTRRLLWVAAGAVLGWHAAIAALWATREPAEDAELWRPPGPPFDHAETGPAYHLDSGGTVRVGRRPT